MKKQFQRIVEHFRPNPEPSGQFYNDWCGKMAEFEPEIIEETVQHYIENFQPNPYKFPTINDFWIVADSINHNRQKEQEKKQDEKAFENIYGGKQDTKVGQKFADLIGKIMHGEITREQAAEEVKRLGKKYDIKSAKREAHHMMTVSDW